MTEVRSLGPVDPALRAEMNEWWRNMGPAMRAALEAAGVDVEYHEDFEKHWLEDPEEAERQTALLEQALEEIKSGMKDVEATTELYNAVADRAKTEGLQSSWERMPKDARARGWHVSRRSHGRVIFTRGGATVGFDRPALGFRGTTRQPRPRARSSRRTNARSGSSASRDGPGEQDPDLDPPGQSTGRLGVPRKAPA